MLVLFKCDTIIVGGGESGLIREKTKAPRAASLFILYKLFTVEQTVSPLEYDTRRRITQPPRWWEI